MILHDSTSDDDDDELFVFEGVVYKTYAELCAAKKQRNLQRMKDLGLLGVTRGLKSAKKKKGPAKKRTRNLPSFEETRQGLPECQKDWQNHQP